MRWTSLVASVAVVALAAVSSSCARSDSERHTRAEDTALPAQSTTTAGEPVSPTVMARGPDDTGPPYLNAVEESLIARLSAVGVVDAGVAEHGYRDAWISGDWEGRTVLVHQYERAQPTTPGKVVGSANIEGLFVTITATDAFGDLARFRCGYYGFDVASFPAGWPAESRSDRSAVETFLMLLIPELDCDTAATVG